MRWIALSVVTLAAPAVLLGGSANGLAVLAALLGILVWCLAGHGCRGFPFLQDLCALWSIVGALGIAIAATWRML